MHGIGKNRSPAGGPPLRCAEMVRAAKTRFFPFYLC